MYCAFCEEEKTFNLKVEGDVGADAIWCDECNCNFDIYDISISKGLRVRLTKWMQQYGKWMDWSKDVLYSNGVQMEDEHNKMGELLTIEVQKELGEKYKVTFSPSSSAKIYANS